MNREGGCNFKNYSFNKAANFQFNNWGQLQQVADREK